MITSRRSKSPLGDFARAPDRQAPPIESKATSGLSVSPYLDSRLKRTFDIAVALAGIAMLGLLLPFIGAAVCATSRGPVFYRRARTGRNGVPFNMIKFRTMVHGSHEASDQLRTKFGDPRITRIGKLLRRTYIDELPQFINVLKGEMSIVGPRPEFPELSEGLTRVRPDFAKRTIAKPGITGLAQVAYRHATDDREAVRRISYDLKYIRNASIRVDVSLVLRTLRRAARLGGY